MRARFASLVLVLAAIAAGCRGAEDAGRVPATATRTARGSALALLRCAAAGNPTREELQTLFGPELAAAERLRLARALEPLRGVQEVQVVGEGPAGHGKTAVDLEASLPAGGAARYTVQAARLPQGAWHIVFLQGPGVSWPASPAPGDDGLTTSGAPAGAPAVDR